MNRPVTRRKALATAGLGLGAVGLAPLLAACSDDDDGGAAGGTTSTTGDTSTTEATSSSTTGSTSSGGATADLFENAASCTLTPEQTEGPYYVDVDSIRSDVREDREGTPLRLALRVSDAGACAPLADAVVDIWHCDALGTYSGVQGDDGTFLRGSQVTNSDGIVEFATVYPGSYTGRTVHIHAKVHVDNTTTLTTQLYFDESITDAVYADEPYASQDGRDTWNADDSIFDDRLILTLSEEDTGWLGVMSVNVDSA